MKLLQINRTDSLGSRFNGLSIADMLAARGIESSHLVWNRFGPPDPRVAVAYDHPLKDYYTWAVNQLEGMLSVQSMLHLQSLFFGWNPAFRAADLVHYHIIHDGYFSLAALPVLTRAKPSVWTFHDPWPMTGHCIYPLDCARWQVGCGNCEDLTLPFPLRRDRTRLNWRYKKLIYTHLDADIIVASRWMRDFVRKSPLTEGMRVHLVPFGVDLDQFKPGDQQAARARFGIFPGLTVIALRAVDNPFKGLEQIKQALRLLPPDREICLLTTQQKGVFDEFIGRHQIVELGWSNDLDLLIDSYRAADFFLMPSTAEAFGLMAIEAMACGKPVISFEGTSLPEVSFAPDVGVAVPMRDSAALAAAVDRWIASPEEVRARGERARRVAVEHYGIALHLDRLIAVYEGALERRRRVAA